MRSDSPRRTRSWHRLATAAAAAALLLTGCASTGGGTATAGATHAFQQVEQSPGATITVWVDSTRLPAAKLFQKEHPDVPVDIVTYDGDANGASTFQTKISLFDKAGSGWPDVVFDENTTDLGWASTGKTPFAAPLDDGIVPKSVLDQFAPGALTPCTNGSVYCLRNDIGQNVLWYNKTLLDKFGYQVPTTWEQYQALGAQVAKEHPGYTVGAVGDSFASYIYFWGAQCPANTLTGTAFSSDTGSPKCVQMAKLLDTMIANGSVTKDAVLTGTKYATTYGGAKTLMLLGPSWFGQYILNAALKVPAGQIAAAPPLKWAADTTATTGDVGGGTWFVSSHSKNLKAASAFVQFETTSPDVQADAPTYPAYVPSAKLWLANPANTKYFATDVAPAFTAAAGEVWPGWSASGLVNQQNIWSTTVMPAVLQGKTIESQLGAWQTEARNLAPTVGYTVTK
ncbi:ABC transporter substrate-binding protein [Streptacidiphilus sp. N1-12]|uniref:ABC transporter substrate-binding protein n=2 Tax=Streptacidiphilus alkalitolerans TaxID=3342712 RepID=A0ABV6VKI3_9ACTN